MTDAQTAETQAAAEPAEVLSWLRNGNARFADAGALDRNHLAQAQATSTGQYPLAAILGCIDSRVPVELVFDVGIGDVFAARTAGNVVDDDIIGSLEFASELAGVKAIVVLGHTECGAVKGACDGAELGHLTQLLTKIRPAVEEASGGESTPGSGDPTLVQRAVEVNIRNSVAALRDRSEVLRRSEQAGTLIITGAIYDLATGRIDWLDQG